MSKELINIYTTSTYMKKVPVNINMNEVLDNINVTSTDIIKVIVEEYKIIESSLILKYPLWPVWRQAV